MIQRRYPRISVNFLASFLGDVTGHGLVENLSFLGCRLRKKEPLPMQEGITLLLHFEAESKACRVEHAVVRWQAPLDLHGIEFVVMAEHDQRLLQRFLASQPQ